ncbi:MAG: single-stranded DNA-binding protein [Anaerolineae bacterium]|nr:single-stranded DNA-binding protein [Anaerolineae bacterium]
MPRGLNKVMLIGRLGRDPEMRYTPSGRPVTTFSLAASRTWNGSDGKRHSETEWFNIVAWSSLAEICNQYLKKGQQVYIEGRLQTRKWEDDKGNPRSTVEVVAGEMIMLGSHKKKDDQDIDKESEMSSGDYSEEDEEQDEFPF